MDSKFKFDAHVASVCRKVGGQVNALNRLQNILPCNVKELWYRAFVLPHFWGLMLCIQTPKSEANLFFSVSVCHFEDDMARDRSPRV